MLQIVTKREILEDGNLSKDISYSSYKILDRAMSGNEN